MKLAIVESPFKCRQHGSRGLTVSDGDMNLQYVKALCLHVAQRGDAPYASHLLCTQFLDDAIPEQRSLGIEIGLAWGTYAAVTIVGVDRGISSGMRYGIERARSEGRPVEWVSLPVWRESWLPNGVNRAGWVNLFVEGDREVRGE